MTSSESNLAPAVSFAIIHPRSEPGRIDPDRARIGLAPSATLANWRRTSASHAGTLGRVGFGSPYFAPGSRSLM